MSGWLVLGREREPPSGVSECCHSPSQHPAAPQLPKLSLNGHQNQLRFGKSAGGSLQHLRGWQGPSWLLTERGH